MVDSRKNTDNRLITKIISGLFYIGLVISFIDIFTIVFRNEDQQGSITIVSIIHYVPIVLLDACGILSFIFERKNYPKYIITCFCILIGWMIFLTIRDYPKSFDLGILFSSKGLMTWLICSLIFVTSNPKRMNNFENLIFYALIILVGYGAIQGLNLSYGFSRADSLKLLLLLMINLFWLLPYFFLDDNNKKNQTIINISLLVLIIIIVLTLTQSYILLFILLIVLKFTSPKNRKHLINGKSILIFLFLILIILLIANSNYYNVIEYAFTNLTNRSSESQGSRLGQLSEFGAQFKISDLFFGSGPASSWNWSAREDSYQYIDNQIFLLLWFGGLVPTVMYLVLFIYPGIKIIFSKKKYIKKNTGYIAFLWLLAMSGLAIYTTYSNNFYYYVFCVYAGINILKNRLSKSSNNGFIRYRFTPTI